MMVAESTDTIIQWNKGPQHRFAASQAQIVIYGGSAGGGKTWAIIAEPLKHINNPRFGAVIFRRTCPQITNEGGLWDESSSVYPAFGAVPRVGDLEWRFPAGSRVSFRHLQHEQNKYDWQGAQVALLCFDELTHFTESQFFYLISRNRSTCGVRPYIRATCNPDPKSWVAQFIAWWIDQETGFPIWERSGAIRYMGRTGDDIIWGDTREEIYEQDKDRFDAAINEGAELQDLIKSVSFIPASLSDNPVLLRKDPGYRANLMALPRVERERLLGGNWKISESTVIPREWIRSYFMRGDILVGNLNGTQVEIDCRQCRRFATIDTAGTSKEKAEEAKGKPPSYSVVGIWDYWPARDMLYLRHVWRDRVGWNDLKARVRETLDNWGCRKAKIENAHYGPALKDELPGIECELIGPVISGMTDSGRGAKLERAVASRLLSRLEDGKMLFPEEATWRANYVGELTAWSGLPDETADQIDVTSYASYVAKKQGAGWGGMISGGAMGRR